MLKIKPFMFLFLVLGITVMSGHALSQADKGTIRGTVSDQNATPLPGATVTLTSESQPARVLVTDAAGHYRFLDLAPGQYQATASMVGFETAANPNIFVSLGATVVVNFTLRPAPPED